MLIPLKLVRDEPLQQQLYDQIRSLILSGRLAPGTRMPSTRMLADQFSISRITALLSYERLLAEGLLKTLPAVGTFVSGSARHAPVPQAPAASPFCHLRVPDIEFGKPDPATFPVQRWRALMRGALDQFGASLGKERPDGHPRLRAAIATWLSTARGLRFSPEQIILTTCRQQALYLAVQLLHHPEQPAIVENPCERHIESILRHDGATLTRIPVDADGLRTELLPDGGASLVHVTPEHQRPLGTVMSLARRKALLAWASRHDVLVIEDDGDAELRYGRMDIPALIHLDRHERVVHAGGFAASLGPGVSTGYLVVPPRLVEAALSVRRLIDGHWGWVEETALAEFLDSGAYALHLHRLRKTYRDRRDALTEAMRRSFGGSVALSGADAGLHLAWTLPDDTGPAPLVATEARRCGLDAAPVVWSGACSGPPTVVLGFGMPEERKMGPAVRQLATRLAGQPACERLSAD